jgi:ABC-2 type transport system ATP-binding protein
MSAVVSVAGLSKQYGDLTALDEVGFTIEENSIVGLLGRNGAGKTTLLRLLTGQEFESSGSIEVFGQHPLENEAVLSRVCFVKESQRYPDSFKVRDVLAAARLMYAGWDDAFAEELLADFDLPVKKTAKSLSRGMLSALGVIVGMASRAPLTFFDEPYLGLDAVARQNFYDRLLADYADHPRTVVLSTHLIDEVADLLERVLLIDRGQLVIDSPADDLRGTAMTVTGPAEHVDRLVGSREVLNREDMGSYARLSVTGTFDETEQAEADRLGLGVEAVSLQQLVVHKSNQRGKSLAVEGEAR